MPFKQSYYSLSIGLSVQARLYGHSSLWIISRSTRDQIEPLIPIVILRKMQMSQRIFAIFGTVMNKRNREGKMEQTFKYFKSQEVPEFIFDADEQKYHESVTMH